MPRRSARLCRLAASPIAPPVRFGRVSEPGGIAAGPRSTYDEVPAGEIAAGALVKTAAGVRWQATGQTFTAFNISCWPLAENERVILTYQRLRLSPSSPAPATAWNRPRWLAHTWWPDGEAYLVARATTPIAIPVVPGEIAGEPNYGQAVPFDWLGGYLSRYAEIVSGGAKAGYVHIRSGPALEGRAQITGEIEHLGPAGEDPPKTEMVAARFYCLGSSDKRLWPLPPFGKLTFHWQQRVTWNDWVDLAAGNFWTLKVSRQFPQNIARLNRLEVLWRPHDQAL